MPVYMRATRVGILTTALGATTIFKGTVAALFSSQTGENDMLSLSQLTEVSYPGYARQALTWGAVGYLIGVRAYSWAASVVWAPNAALTTPVQAFAWGIILPGVSPAPDQLIAYGVLPAPLTFTDTGSVYTMSIQVGTDMPAVITADG